MGVPPEDEVDEFLKGAKGALLVVGGLVFLAELEQAAFGQTGAIQDLLDGHGRKSLLEQAPIGPFDGPRQDAGLMLRYGLEQDQQ